MKSIFIFLVIIFELLANTNAVENSTNHISEDKLRDLCLNPSLPISTFADYYNGYGVYYGQNVRLFLVSNRRRFRISARLHLSDISVSPPRSLSFEVSATNEELGIWVRDWVFINITTLLNHNTWSLEMKHEDWTKIRESRLSASKYQFRYMNVTITDGPFWYESHVPLHNCLWFGLDSSPISIGPAIVSSPPRAKGPILVLGGNERRGAINDAKYINCAQVNNSAPCTDKPSSITGNFHLEYGIYAAALVNDKIYLCKTEERYCLKADATVFPLTFNRIDHPVTEITSPRSVVVGDEVWFVGAGYRTLTVLDTKTDTFSEFDLPGSSNWFPACFAHHDGVTYAIGLGSKGNEIWKNVHSNQKSSWVEVGAYDGVTQRSSCIRLGHTIWAVGGYTHISRHEVIRIDVRNDSVSLGPVLPTGIHNHQMAVMNDRVTVFDGSYSTPLTFSLNEASGRWEDSPIKVDERNSDIILIQFP